jgi:hypothetical protein
MASERPSLRVDWVGSGVSSEVDLFDFRDPLVGPIHARL